MLSFCGERSADWSRHGATVIDVCEGFSDPAHDIFRTERFGAGGRSGVAGAGDGDKQGPPHITAWPDPLIGGSFDERPGTRESGVAD